MITSSMIINIIEAIYYQEIQNYKNYKSLGLFAICPEHNIDFVFVVKELCDVLFQTFPTSCNALCFERHKEKHLHFCTININDILPLAFLF